MDYIYETQKHIDLYLIFHFFFHFTFPLRPSLVSICMNEFLDSKSWRQNWDFNTETFENVQKQIGFAKEEKLEMFDLYLVMQSR